MTDEEDRIGDENTEALVTALHRIAVRFWDAFGVKGAPTQVIQPFEVNQGVAALRSVLEGICVQKVVVEWLQQFLMTAEGNAKAIAATQPDLSILMKEEARFYRRMLAVKGVGSADGTAPYLDVPLVEAMALKTVIMVLMTAGPDEFPIEANRQATTRYLAIRGDRGRGGMEALALRQEMELLTEFMDRTGLTDRLSQRAGLSTDV